MNMNSFKQLNNVLFSFIRFNNLLYRDCQKNQTIYEALHLSSAGLMDGIDGISVQEVSDPQIHSLTS